MKPRMMLAKLSIIVRGLTFCGQGKTVNTRILTAALTVGFSAIIVKVISLAKELVVANAFGRGDTLDAYLIAFLVPSFAINVIGGSLNAALIPTFIEVRESKGKEAAQRLFSNVVVLSGALLVIVSFVLALFAPLILRYLGSGFSAQKLELTTRLFMIMLPVLVVNGLATTWGAVLNASERFALASLSSIALPLAIIVSLMMFDGERRINALSAGTVAGFTLEALLIAWGLRRTGFSPVPRWSGMDNDLRQVMKQYAPMVAGGLLMSSTLLVDNAMAAMLPSGSVAALSYGNRIVAAIIGIGASGLGTAALPYLSKIVTNRDWEELRKTLKMYLYMIFMITIPLTLVLVFFSEPLTRFMFERGAFMKSDTQLVGRVQAFFLLQIPFYIAGIFMVRMISAFKENKILMWGAGISVVVNIVMNYIGMIYLGVSGIALSTSIVYMLSFVYMLTTLRHLIKSQVAHAGP